MWRYDRDRWASWALGPAAGVDFPVEFKLTFEFGNAEIERLQGSIDGIRKLIMCERDGFICAVRCQEAYMKVLEV